MRFLFHVPLDVFVADRGAARADHLHLLRRNVHDRHRMALPNDFDRYTLVMVRNAAFNLWKREQRFVHDAEMEADKAGQQTPSIEEQAENQELFLVYEQALQALSPRCREVWQLVKEEGLSYAEVATQLEISTKTVDAQMQKALKHLRSEVGTYLEQHESTKTKKLPLFLFFSVLGIGIIPSGVVLLTDIH